MLAIENKRSDLTLLTLSFAAMSLLVGFGVFTYWWTQNAVQIGVTRAGLFVAAMAGVHVLGAALYVTQNQSRGNSHPQLAKSWTLRGSLWVALTADGLPPTLGELPVEDLSLRLGVARQYAVGGMTWIQGF